MFSPASRRVAIQSASLNIASSILAQLITSYRSGKASVLASPQSSLLSIDLWAVFQYLIPNLLLTGPNVQWQQLLENTFPGYPIRKGKQKIKIDEDGTGVTVEQKLDIKNTAIKFLLDNTIGASVNTCLFLITLKVLRGGTMDECVATITEGEFWPMMIAGYKLWPLVSLFNLTVVPVEHRVLVGSFVGLFWGIYVVLTTT
ncbi:hypothetical protein MMC19_002495 [Ptychographa xylographoides]|nr:hypothetical protein [Ptychographa xylographoides]